MHEASRHFILMLNPSSGEAQCPEDAAAAAAVNKFLAEELARVCCYNKSHSCFTADLQAFKRNQHVDEAIKKGLQGLDTYAKVPMALVLCRYCLGLRIFHSVHVMS